MSDTKQNTARKQRYMCTRTENETKRYACTCSGRERVALGLSLSQTAESALGFSQTAKSALGHTHLIR